ncbi:unnamed protein product [Amoebophrya sp. A120]|nr:unnamed protein product [Amoebophrya sp. A120]|eukprot:GSA120T00009131001.1
MMRLLFEGLPAAFARMRTVDSLTELDDSAAEAQAAHTAQAVWRLLDRVERFLVRVEKEPPPNGAATVQVVLRPFLFEIFRGKVDEDHNEDAMLTRLVAHRDIGSDKIQNAIVKKVESLETSRQEQRIEIDPIWAIQAASKTQMHLVQDLVPGGHLALPDLLASFFVCDDHGYAEADTHMLAVLQNELLCITGCELLEIARQHLHRPPPKEQTEHIGSVEDTALRMTTAARRLLYLLRYKQIVHSVIQYKRGCGETAILEDPFLQRGIWEPIWDEESNRPRLAFHSQDEASVPQSVSDREEHDMDSAKVELVDIKAWECEGLIGAAFHGPAPRTSGELQVLRYVSIPGLNPLELVEIPSPLAKGAHGGSDAAFATFLQLRGEPRGLAWSPAEAAAAGGGIDRALREAVHPAQWQYLDGQQLGFVCVALVVVFVMWRLNVCRRCCRPSGLTAPALCGGQTKFSKAKLGSARQKKQTTKRSKVCHCVSGPGCAPATPAEPQQEAQCSRAGVSGNKTESPCSVLDQEDTGERALEPADPELSRSEALDEGSREADAEEEHCLVAGVREDEKLRSHEWEQDEANFTPNTLSVSDLATLAAFDDAAATESEQEDYEQAVLLASKLRNKRKW